MKEDKVFASRVEKRFLVPYQLLDERFGVLSEFTEHFPVNEDGTTNNVTQSIYFGRDEKLHQNGLIRARRYMSQPQLESLSISDSDPVFLEIKKKVGEIIKKGRLKTSYEIVQLLMLDPKEARLLLLNDKTLNLSIEDIDSLLGEMYFLKLYPQFAIQCIRKHFHPSDDSLDCRITFDNDLRYFAFSESSANSAVPMGNETLAKMEVKYAQGQEKFALSLISLIVKAGGVPINTLQPKVESMYRESVKLFGYQKNPALREELVQSDPMHSVQNVEFVNEFPDSELEVKLQATPVNADKLMKILFSHLKAGLFGDFKLVEGKEEVSYWTYYFDNFAYSTDHGLEEAFVIVHHPDKSRFMIKAKLPGKSVNVGDDVEALQREEEVIKVDRTYETTDAEVIKSMYEFKIGKPIEYVGTNKRVKYYLFIEHPKSRRYYNIAVDHNVHNQSEMVQVEVEYKGKHTDSTEPDSKEAVHAEVAQIVQELRSLPLFVLEPTKLRKFDWILQS